jgi:hypothetical protein
VFLCPPLRTVLAPFGAHGSPGIGDFPLLVIGSPFVGAARVTRDTRTSPSDLQLLVNPNVNPLAPFALYAAFPHSDYYGASDSLVWHRWMHTFTSIPGPPTFMIMDSARVFRW